MDFYLQPGSRTDNRQMCGRLQGPVIEINKPASKPANWRRKSLDQGRDLMKKP